VRIALVTDAWHPQVNGVVTTLERTCREVGALGHAVHVVSPQGFRTVPAPSERSLRLALWPRPGVRHALDRLAPDAIHIATEGPLGIAARAWCLTRGRPFTTAYHTAFPEYLRLRLRIPPSLSYAWLRRFHGAAARTMVSTASQRAALLAHGFRNLVAWGRGVDTALFRPRAKDVLGLPRPIAIYVGRVAVEKNIEAFLRTPLPGSKVVVGDGPARARLHGAYPDVHFTGMLRGEALAAALASADVFVFPSRTDTFGLVLLEALASGVPVAAYPVTGPRDTIRDGVTGALDEDLHAAVRRALACDPAACVAYARRHSWEASARQFLANLVEEALPAAA
jgi:glycosyltransferase involved in cell wall biosynthesis